MVQCKGCERNCRKVSTNNATMQEFMDDIKAHNCSKPENKAFKVNNLKIRKIISVFKLTFRDTSDIF